MLEKIVKPEIDTVELKAMENTVSSFCLRLSAVMVLRLETV